MDQEHSSAPPSATASTLLRQQLLRGRDLIMAVRERRGGYCGSGEDIAKVRSDYGCGLGEVQVALHLAVLEKQRINSCARLSFQLAPSSMSQNSPTPPLISPSSIAKDVGSSQIDHYFVEKKSHSDEGFVLYTSASRCSPRLASEGRQQVIDEVAQN